MSIDMEDVVIIDYTNHRGERRERRIRPDGIRFDCTQWHPELQWLLRGYDFEKMMWRDFAIKDLHSWRPENGSDK